ncbi:MAG: hypothetical protein ACOYKQ_13845, partial [Polymorphobacter sp.]
TQALAAVPLGKILAEGKAPEIMRNTGIVGAFAKAMGIPWETLEAVMAMVNAANGFFADNAPWKLAKTDVAAMGHVLHATLDATRRIVLLVQPVMPEASTRLLDLLGVAANARQFNNFNTAVISGTQLPEPQGVFPRWAEPA